MSRLSGKNFPGSSGYWGDLGSRVPAGGQREGMGYPGGRARAQLAAEEGVQLSPTAGALPGQRYGFDFGRNSRLGRSTSANLYEPLQITKSPSLAAGAERLFGELNQPPQGFEDLLREAKEAAAELRAAYQREQGAYNIEPFASNLRRLDDRLEALTGDYAGTARDIGGRYAASDADYAGDVSRVTGRAYGLLPEYNRAAENIAQNQERELQGRVSRYKIGGGNLGLGSDELRKISRGVADVRLPLERERIQREYDVLTGVDLPGQREIATREASRLSQFELPMERDIYSQFYATDLQRKNTENQIKQLEIATAGMSRQAAEGYLRSLALPSELINSILMRREQVTGSRIANLGALGGVEDAAYYRGLEYLPGSGPLFNPTYYGLPSGAYPRGGPPNTALPSRITNNGADRYMSQVREDFPYSSRMMGSFTVPNNYTWGRSPAEQAAFERIQASYQ